jgi:hypothetical protein
MSIAIHKTIKKAFDAPDACHDCGRGRLEVVELGDTCLSHVVMQPGWKWSRDVGPSTDTTSCQTQHIQYCLRGRLAVEMDDGSRIELGRGDCAVIAPGHDAWVVGDEPFEAIDFSPDMRRYAQPHS